MTFTERHYPDKIGTEQLDKYLSNGWFRMGQMMFTCWFLVFDYELFSAIWIRQDLQNHQFRKSHRKILRKVQNDFTTIVRPAIFDKEKDELYSNYRKRFDGYISENLKESLFDNGENNIFNTWEVAVYDNDRLIAASFFDVGTNSVASIIGLFHQDYGSYSLGFYSMLAEIEWAKSEGMQYYYPGYIVPGYERFDYKTRIGKVDYYDLHKRTWLPFEQLAIDTLPVERLRTKLGEVKELLNRLDLPNHLVLYPMYDRDVYPFSKRDQINHPLFLLCGYRDAPFIIEYDLIEEQFLFSSFNELMDLDCFNRRINRNGKSTITCYFPLIKEDLLAKNKKAPEICKALIKELNF